MSINVTITGNPVSIKKGKMVTFDRAFDPTYQSKKEYEQRRLMRLQQVRQQSKEIAEDVRNKVRREKEKQKRLIENDGKEKLKNWQNKRLFELQNQYEDALQDLGSGHKQAKILEDENLVLAEQKEHNDKVASFRGQVAATHLQIEKNKENMKKAIPAQKKKIVRDIENTRASLVAGINKNKTSSPKSKNKTRKAKNIANISITIPQSDSESTEFTSGNASKECSPRCKQIHGNNVEDIITSSCNCTDVSESPREPMDFDVDNSSPDRTTQQHQASPHQAQRVTRVNDLTKDTQNRKRLIEEFRQRSGNVGPPLDTRISDRIKRRELMSSQTDYCDTVAQTHPTPFLESNTQIRDAVEARNVDTTADINCVCGHKCPEICGSNFKEKTTQKDDLGKKGSTFSQGTGAQSEIPEKPPVKVKDKKYSPDKKYSESSKDTLKTYDSHKVSYYDHPNRFSQEKQFPSSTHVEKITADSLEVIPNITSESEWHEKMKQRDREAHIRGQRALEKEKIQKDYEDMLKRLPLLQKKERICEISKDKQEYHMSDERLKQRDRKKQNDMDNAYSKLFPNLKPAVVTLPSRNDNIEDKTSATNEPLQSLNIGKWDVDHEDAKIFSAEEVQEIIKAFTEQKPQNRREKLKQLLKSLKLQKQQLIKEIKSLPPNSSIHELLSDLNSFSDSDAKSRSKSRKGKVEKSERKRRREETDKESSTDSTTESSSTASSKHGKGKKTKSEQKVSDTKTPSPRKKAKIKSKRKVLILQNMSTQTTPKAITDSDQAEPKTGDGTRKKEERTCPKLHVPCDCNKENVSADELCQIVIKLNDNDDPQVVIKSKEKDVKIPEAVLVKQKRSPSKRVESKSIGVGTDELLRNIPRDKKIADVVSASSTTRKDTEDSSSKSNLKKHKTDVKPYGKRDKIFQTESTAKSWKEQLSKNSISTSSTSYLSPPNFQTTDSQAQSVANEQSKQSLYNLRKKPQQSNLPDVSSALSEALSMTSSRSSDKVDPKLVAYIQKLLSMSRGSIENLTVSTSSVQTPSQSVIEIESNNPLSQLHNAIKHLNLKNVYPDLSYSPDFSPIHYNTSASASEVSQPQHAQARSSSNRVDGSSKTDKTSSVTVDKETSSSSVRSKDSVLAQYADITDSCSKRIAQLAAMIEQIREEKIQMLQHPPAAGATDKDKDYSTAYLDLPASNDSSSKYSSINSLDDEELHKRLLEIDFSLADKLRKFSTRQPEQLPGEDAERAERPGGSNDTVDDGNNTNTELWSRLKRLTQQEGECCPNQPCVPAGACRESFSFVPFLSDIPKLPKFEPQPESSRVELGGLHKRPPPSRALSVAKKFNGNISLVPHELSTIVEADSQLSTKVASANNSKTSQDISPQKNFQLVVQPEQEQVTENGTTTSRDSSKSNKSSPSQLTKVFLTPKSDDKHQHKGAGTRKSKTPPPSLVENSSEGSSQSIVVTCKSTAKSLQMSSSSSDDMESIEAMLRSIGMEWAIPTLHKTKEALALTSSSSSLELSSKKKLATDASGSEVSLKQYLKKQIKISSSTMKSDASPVSFSGELSELSSIQGNNYNADQTHQRTSTPIISSKSTEKSGKQVAFSGSSDISSVRDDGQKVTDKSSQTSYRSLSEYSQSKSDI